MLASLAADPDEVLGCNTRADLAEVDPCSARASARRSWTPASRLNCRKPFLIDPDVIVGADTRIEPGVQLLGKTRIGAGCTIRTGSMLHDADARRQRAREALLRRHRQPSRRRRAGRARSRIFANGARLMRRRARGQFRGSEEERARRRREGHAPHLSGRRARSAATPTSAREPSPAITTA